MRSRLAVLVLVTAALGCAAAGPLPEVELMGMRTGRPAAVIGTVVEAGTDRPLAFVSIAVDSYPFASTDTNGYFTLPHLSDGPHRIVAARRGFRPASLPATMRRGRVDTLRFTLEPAAPACCALYGVWTLRLALDSAGAMGPAPTARETIGRVVFSDSAPAPPTMHRSVRSGITGEEGRFDVDLAPFFGGRYAKDVSTTVFGPVDENFFREAAGAVFHGDSVSITLIPRMTHGGLSLRGRIAADSIAGEWYQNAYCCGASGRFWMRRLAEPVPPPAPPKPATSETTPEVPTGRAQVRVYDEATRRYLELCHALELPDGRFRSSYTTGTEPGGWGEPFDLPAGRYRVVIDEYPCGRASYVPAENITVPFEVRVGELTPVEVRIDTRAIQPAPSHTNLGAKRCRR